MSTVPDNQTRNDSRNDGRINDALKKPIAKTKGYSPIQTWWLRRHQKLPVMSFQVIEQILLDETIQIGLAARRAAIQGVEFGYEMNGQWQVGVMCQDEAVGAWVMRQIRKLWSCALEHISSAQVYGWSGMEVIWERSEEFGTWEIATIEQRHANDVRVLVSNETGRPCGVRFMHVKSALEGYVDLRFPESFFHSYDAQPGELYGRSVLTGAYRAWADKHFDGGAIDVRRLFMHKDAYGGADLRYPEGSTDVGTIDQPHEVSNRELAREIVEQLEAGGVTTTPAQYDDKGNPMWQLTRATVPSNPSHILQYPGDLDGEMLRGMFVPDGVLKADDTGSWQGRLIPMGILYANLDPWVEVILRDIKEQLLEPGIINNFGRLIPFDVAHKPLAKQALEQQRGPSMGGMGGMDPSMGGMDPGMDPMGGMDDGMGGMDDPSQPQMMGLDPAAAVGEGVLSAAELVKAARMALRGPQRMDATHAPKGYTKSKPLVIDGNEYYGGMFIPGDVVAKASESQRKEIESGKKTDSPTEKSRHHDLWSKKIAHMRQLKLKNGHKVQINVARKAGGKFEHAVRHYSPDRKRTDYEDTFDTMEDAADFAAKVLHSATSEKDEPEKEKAAEAAKPERPDGTPVDPVNRHVYTVPVDSLHVDPARFQYKVKNIDPNTGVTGELKESGRWNPELAGALLVWRDPDDGKDYVVNGHHRHHLARRLGADELNVRYIEAKNATEARAKGALANIAEGRGSAIDAAKYLRDSGHDVDHFREAGISMSGAIAAQAAILKDLSEKPFQMVTQGRLDEGKALAVAKHLKDHALQDKLFKRLEDREEDGKEWSLREIETAARKMSNAGKVVQAGFDLFGAYEDEQDTFDQEVEIEAYIARELSKEANDYRALADKRRADRVAGVGNILVVDENQRKADEASAAAGQFDRESHLRGQVADTVKKYAADLAFARNRKQREQIKSDALAAIRTVMSESEVDEPQLVVMSAFSTIVKCRSKEEAIAALDRGEDVFYDGVTLRADEWEKWQADATYYTTRNQDVQEQALTAWKNYRLYQKDLRTPKLFETNRRY